jgi:hypothetical protein
MDQATHTDTSPPFELSAPVAPGEVPSDVVSELEHLCDEAIDSAKAFTDACKEQGNKFNVSRAALRRFIRARRSDKLAQLDQEALAILGLIEHNGRVSSL